MKRAQGAREHVPERYRLLVDRLQARFKAAEFNQVGQEAAELFRFFERTGDNFPGGGVTLRRGVILQGTERAYDGDERSL